MLTFLGANAQKWTLRQCIEYALEHNITLKQRENSNKQRELDISNAKNSRLPDLNFGAGENLSFGRGLTKDNTYTNNSTTSTDFSLSTSVPLLTGMRIPNQIKLSKLNLSAAVADLEKAKNDISTNVAQYYIQVIYNRELADIAKRQVSIDSMQVERLRIMMENGKASQVDVSQQESALAQSRLTLTNAQNDVSISLLNLSQMLELPSPEGFDIAIPTLEDSNLPSLDASLSPDAIFAEAMNIKPEIAAEQIRLQGAEYAIKIAKADLYPTLSLRGGIGSNYYETSGFKSDGFGSQIKNNFSQSIGLNLSVPIFNRFQTKNNIKRAELDFYNQQLTLDNAKKALYKEIQQVYYNALSAKSRYESSVVAVKSSDAAFSLIQSKYENGKANITEFNESKNNVLKAQSDLVNAKYNYVYEIGLIGFYRNGGLFTLPHSGAFR